MTHAVTQTILSGMVLLAVCAVGLGACSPREDHDGELKVVAEAEPVKTLSCTWPVGPTTPAAAVLGNPDFAAKQMTIPGPEGTELTAIVIHPDDPARRIEIVYWDAAMQHVSNVALGEEAKIAGPFGVHLGDTVTAVEAANGGAISMSGFGWDYGGYVNDYRGGKLASVPGGCNLSVRFADGEGEAPEGVYGDGVTVKSEGVRQWAPKVSEISVGWPLPSGVIPAQ